MTRLQCNVCGQPLGEPIFRSTASRGLTSLCEPSDTPASVWACTTCGHLRGLALPDAAAYYATGYRILLDHEDEDQIYEVDGERIVYRTEHQLRTLLGKLALPPGAALLDYGCAKASTPRLLSKARADLAIHLFDVSEMYTAHWDAFVPIDRRALHQTPGDWQARFDVVTSFFALEHIVEPVQTLRRIAALLKLGGTLYGIVPNTFGNPADFVVVDHVNHFTRASLAAAIHAAGLTVTEIDAEAHRGALVFTALKAEPVNAGDGRDVADALAGARRLGDFWSGFGDAVRKVEAETRGQRAAVYGSGFYGAYIATVLRDADGIECFLDRNPHRQGKTLFGKPVIAPEALSDDVGVLYVGLNPAIARSTVDSMPALQRSGRRIEVFAPVGR